MVDPAIEKEHSEPVFGTDPHRVRLESEKVIVVSGASNHYSLDISIHDLSVDCSLHKAITSTLRLAKLSVNHGISANLLPE